MTTEALLDTGRELIAPWTKEIAEPEARRLDAVIEAGDLLAAVEALHNAKWGYLSAITGLDQGVEAGIIEVLYHFCNEAAVLTLRVRVPREAPVVPSLYGLIQSVTFYERELMEMLGVTVTGTPNSDRLFLPEDWPDGVYPLRKDFRMEQLHEA
ncbi:MAG TPA: NADH-quinone oxidoreductase subunit C [Aggregatilinea sp.]|jgi:Ni,Fe-hydrogenase III component G|uniref:NADH-quinone oxidoreductase subunit C n=1 Tax=Aggregatilinea sp. TaxID=2806333 RepID=UPI002CB02247|nr:NADH-quinone oxidoreductase subunit C [Aggregatilinea sp.]HML24509.1 NADH-quinone oxidoreductase subunit C [Aggregatilinea sp.]